ncbi:MAG: hypothetical protein ACM3SY_11410 [Candidatus Omnitrophota bacterium]
MIFGGDEHIGSSGDKMKGMSMKIMVLSLIVLLGLMVYSITAKPSKNVYFWIEKKNGKVLYRVESQIIPGRKLLDYFGDLLDAKGEDSTIYIICQDDLPVSYIDSAKSTIQKVADFKIRYFLFNKRSETAQEIFFLLK